MASLGPHRLQEGWSEPRPQGVQGQEELPGSLHGCWWGSHLHSRWTKAWEPHWLPSATARGLVPGQLATQRRHSGGKTPVACSSPASRTFPARGRGSEVRAPVPHRCSSVGSAPLSQVPQVLSVHGLVRWVAACARLRGPGGCPPISPSPQRENTHILAAHSSLAPRVTIFHTVGHWATLPLQRPLPSPPWTPSPFLCPWEQAQDPRASPAQG